MLVIESLSDLINDETLENLSAFLNERGYIPDRIKSRLDSDIFWSQPVAILSYLLAYEHPSLLKDSWPFSESEEALELVYSDLGKKYHS